MEAKITRNQKHDGLNVSFESKPDAGTLAYLRGLGFRWQPYEKYWYKKYSVSLEEKVRKYFEGSTVSPSEGYKKPEKSDTPSRKLNLPELKKNSKAARKDVIIKEIEAGKMEYASYKHFDGMTDSWEYTHPKDDSDFSPAEKAMRTYNNGRTVNFVIEDLQDAIGRNHYIYSTHVAYSDKLGYYITFSNYYIRYKGEKGKGEAPAVKKDSEFTFNVGDVLKEKGSTIGNHYYIESIVSPGVYSAYQVWHYGFNNDLGRFGIKKEISKSFFAPAMYEISTLGSLLYFIDSLKWNIADTYQSFYGTELSDKQKMDILKLDTNPIAKEVLRKINLELSEPPVPKVSESAEQKAIGLMGGSIISRVKERGYTLVYGEMSETDYWNVVGWITGYKADKLKAAGITIKKNEVESEDEEDRKVFGYNFNFFTVNKEAQLLQNSLTYSGFKSFKAEPDFINGLEFSYFDVRYRIFDNSGEFKIDNLQTNEYIGVVYFKEQGKLKSIKQLAHDIYQVIRVDRMEIQRKAKNPPAHDVDDSDEITIAKAKAKARIRILKLKAQVKTPPASDVPHYPGKKINPHPEVFLTDKVIIEDLIKSERYKDLDIEDGAMLVDLFWDHQENKDGDITVDLQEDDYRKWTYKESETNIRYIDKSVDNSEQRHMIFVDRKIVTDEQKKKYTKDILQYLHERGYVYFNEDKLTVYLEPKGLDFILAGEKQVQTRKDVQAGYDLFPHTLNIPELKYEIEKEFAEGGNIPMSKQFLEVYEIVKKASSINIVKFAEEIGALNQYNKPLYDYLVSAKVPLIKVDKQMLKTHALFKLYPPPIREAVFWCSNGRIGDKMINNIYASVLPQAYTGLGAYAIKMGTTYAETLENVLTHEAIHAYINTSLRYNAGFESELSMLREYMQRFIEAHVSDFNAFEKRVWLNIYGDPLAMVFGGKKEPISEMITYSFTMEKVKQFFQKVLISEFAGISAWDKLVNIVSINDSAGHLLIYAQKYNDLPKMDFSRAVMKYKMHIKSTAPAGSLMKDGGLVEGVSHEEGGVDLTVMSTGENVELEGGEAVIKKAAVDSSKKYKFEGKEVRPKVILDKINRDAGGKPIK